MEEKRGYREREREAGRKAVKKNTFSLHGWAVYYLDWGLARKKQRSQLNLF